MEYELRERIFKDGTKHIEKICLKTGKHLGFVKSKSNADFVIYRGKYKGKMLKEIAVDDWDYLLWCSENLNDEKLRKRIEEYLEELAEENKKERDLQQKKN